MKHSKIKRSRDSKNEDHLDLEKNRTEIQNFFMGYLKNKETNRATLDDKDTKRHNDRASRKIPCIKKTVRNEHNEENDEDIFIENNGLYNENKIDINRNYNSNLNVRDNSKLIVKNYSSESSEKSKGVNKKEKYEVGKFDKEKKTNLDHQIKNINIHKLNDIKIEVENPYISCNDDTIFYVDENYFNITNSKSIHNSFPDNNTLKSLNFIGKKSFNYYIKCQENDFCIKDSRMIEINYYINKARVRVQFIMSSIHKPDIINIKEFSTDVQKLNLDIYLKKLLMHEVAMFLSENVISCFSLYTNEPNGRNKEILASYYKIMCLFNIDTKFAILENKLKENQTLVMIEISQFVFAQCLPKCEFIILSINNDMFDLLNSNR